MQHEAGTDRHEDPVEQRLRDAGVTPTRQRLAIAGVLLSRPQHLSADQLVAELRRTGVQRVSKATIYNTLSLFARVGLIRQVIADPQRIVYDSNVSFHHHLYDVDTGTLTDIEPDQVQVGAIHGIPADLEIAGVDVIVRVRRSDT
jgi:Fur family iron response transcriptional regulator